MSDQQSPEIAQPGKGPLNYPTQPVVRSVSLLARSRSLSSSLWYARTDAPAPEVDSEGLTVIDPVCYQLFRSGPRPTWALLGNPHQAQDLLSQLDFCLLGTVQQHRQGKTVAIHRQHQLGAFAFSGEPYPLGPLLAGAKLPSRKTRSQSNRPCSSSVVSKARKIPSHTPCSSHRSNAASR